MIQSWRICLFPISNFQFVFVLKKKKYKSVRWSPSRGTGRTTFKFNRGNKTPDDPDLSLDGGSGSYSVSLSVDQSNNTVA